MLKCEDADVEVAHRTAPAESRRSRTTAAMAQVPWAVVLDQCLDYCNSTATASVQASHRWDEPALFWRRMWQRALERDQVHEDGLSGVLATKVVLALAALSHDHESEAVPVPAPTAAPAAGLAAATAQGSAATSAPGTSMV